MSHTEAIAVGDLHLEKLFKWFDPELALAYTFSALEAAYKYAVENSVQFVILLGDIFDTATPEQRTVDRFNQFLATHNKVTWLIIRGNHDIHDTHTSSLIILKGIDRLNLMPHVRVFLSPELLDLDGIKFLMMPYPYRKIDKWLKPDEFAVVCPHLEFRGAQTDNGFISKDGAKLPKGCQIWVSGHLHTKQVVGERLFYPGTMLQLNMVEKPEKFFLHMTIDGEKFTPKFVPYKTPFQLFNLVIATEADLERVDARNPKHRYRLVVKNGVKVPLKVRNSPYVVMHGYQNREEKKSVIKGMLHLSKQEHKQFDVTYGLKTFLKSKGHDASDVKEAVSFARSLAKSIGVR